MAGCKEIIALNLFDNRFVLACELGATHVVNPEKKDVVDRVRVITGRGVGFALHKTGNGEVIQKAFEYLKIGGVSKTDAKVLKLTKRYNCYTISLCDSNTILKKVKS